MMKRQKASKNLKKAWAEGCRLCLGFILSFSLGFFIITQARAEQVQNFVYEVYAGGIHAVQTKVALRHDQDRYSLVLDAKTRGFLGALVPWEGTFESHGWVDEKGYKPELHKSTTTWRDEIEISEYNYNRDGSFDSLVMTDHDKAPEKRMVDDELTQGTVDTITAALEVMREVGTGGECNGSSEVFDGKRRFEQIFKHEKAEQLQSSRYNIYEGESVKCTVEVKPVAGAWHKKPRGWLSIQEQGRKRGTMPTVWMGKVTEDGPAIPVKIFVKTAYGALYMHLAEYGNGQDIVVAEKRVTDEE